MPGPILHIDMDAFYASIEILDNPALRGKPVIVGAPGDKRGVVSTASYEARKFGVRSAMPSRTAKKLCPQGIFVPVRMSRYLEISERIMAILDRFTPLVEPVSVDEAFMDISGAPKRWGGAVEIARKLKATILKEEKLTASVGVAPNKFLSKVASDLQKPDGLVVVPDDEDGIREFLSPLPVERIWGVGKVTSMRLAQSGIHTIADVQARTEKELAQWVGSSLAGHIMALAFGRDDREIVTDREAKSISSEHTFDEDVEDRSLVQHILLEQAERVGHRLRESRGVGRTAQLKLRYDNFETITRQQKLAAPTNADRDLIRCATDLLAKHAEKRPVRLVGFGIADLSAAGREESPELFAEFDPSQRTRKDARLDKAVDALRSKFGRKAIRRGG